jgi:5'-nucleotidase
MKTLYNHLLLVIFLSFSVGIWGQVNLVILHTNDTHSRIEPLPATDSRYANLGGVERRAAYFDLVRKDNKNVLIFDSGDFLQGTPYFNMFKGEVEIETMNLLKYDATTLGNHEFDYGLNTIADFARRAKFPIVCTNYDFTGTPVEGLTKPYIILKKGGIRIGVIGIGIQPKGLIASANYEGMKFLPPIPTANRYADMLKKEKNCDIVICLSHLGYTDDVNLAEKSHNIDFILGGHSHTFMKEAKTLKNADGKDIVIFQNGDRGMYIGRLDVELEKTKK